MTKLKCRQEDTWENSVRAGREAGTLDRKQSLPSGIVCLLLPLSWCLLLMLPSLSHRLWLLLGNDLIFLHTETIPKCVIRINEFPLLKIFLLSEDKIFPKHFRLSQVQEWFLWTKQTKGEMEQSYHFCYGGTGECKADGEIFSASTERTTRGHFTKAKEPFSSALLKMYWGFTTLNTHILRDRSTLRNRAA